MPLSDQDAAKVIEYLNAKSKRSHCPECDGASWSPKEIIGGNGIVDGRMMMGQCSVPMVQVICTGCGFIKLFSAYYVGLLD